MQGDLMWFTPYKYQSHLLVYMFPWPVVIKCNIAYFERFRNGYTQCTWDIWYYSWYSLDHCKMRRASKIPAVLTVTA